jgi:ADP-ribosylglycohydrolase
MINQTDSIIGCLLGTAVGDALGLPCEGLSKHRQRQIYPNITRHHFFFNKGMVSDDTEHTCLVAQSLIISGDNEQLFRREWAFVKASTRITHTDPKAEFGALAVAIAAYLASCHSIVSPQAYYQTLQEVLGMEATEFLELIKKFCAPLAPCQNSDSPP